MKCAVTKAYEAMGEQDREVFRTLIQDPGYTGSHIAAILNTAFKGSTLPAFDRAAVNHFRRKLLVGKATL